MSVVRRVSEKRCNSYNVFVTLLNTVFFILDFFLNVEEKIRKYSLLFYIPQKNLKKCNHITKLCRCKTYLYHYIPMRADTILTNTLVFVVQTMLAAGFSVIMFSILDDIFNMPITHESNLLNTNCHQVKSVCYSEFYCYISTIHT